MSTQINQGQRAGKARFSDLSFPSPSLVGLAAAHALADLGYEVRLLERDQFVLTPYIGAEAPRLVAVFSRD